MRLLLDTNILVSGLLSRETPPALLLTAWIGGHFELLTSKEQLDELRGVLCSAEIAARVDTQLTDAFASNLEAAATIVTGIPGSDAPVDPGDHTAVVLAMAGDGCALVCGDEAVVPLLREDGVPVMTALEAAAMLGLSGED